MGAAPAWSLLVATRPAFPTDGALGGGLCATGTVPVVIVMVVTVVIVMPVVVAVIVVVAMVMSVAMSRGFFDEQKNFAGSHPLEVKRVRPCCRELVCHPGCNSRAAFDR